MKRVSYSSPKGEELVSRGDTRSYRTLSGSPVGNSPKAQWHVGSTSAPIWTGSSVTITPTGKNRTSQVCSPGTTTTGGRTFPALERRSPTSSTTTSCILLANSIPPTKDHPNDSCLHDPVPVSSHLLTEVPKRTNNFTIINYCSFTCTCIAYSLLQTFSCKYILLFLVQGSCNLIICVKSVIYLGKICEN